MSRRFTIHQSRTGGSRDDDNHNDKSDGYPSNEAAGVAIPASPDLLLPVARRRRATIKQSGNWLQSLDSSTGHGILMEDDQYLPTLTTSRSLRQARHSRSKRAASPFTAPYGQPPIPLRQKLRALKKPRTYLYIARRLLIYHPFVLLYFLWILCVGLYPITVKIPRTKYGFIVRPYPEPTDVFAYLQKFVLPRGGWTSSWIDWRFRNAHNRHFMWNFPISELMNTKAPDEFPIPNLTSPVRTSRRRLEENRHGGMIQHAGFWDQVVLNRNSASPTLPLEKRTLQSVRDTDDRSEFFRRIYNGTSLHHHRDDTDLLSPAYLAIHTFSTATVTSRAERDLVRRYQRTRIPPEYYHLLDFQFVICSPFGLYDHLLQRPSFPYKNQTSIQQHEAWDSLKAEQEEYGDILIVDEMAEDRNTIMKENMDQGKTYAWLREVSRRAEDGRGRQAMFVM